MNKHTHIADQKSATKPDPKPQKKNPPQEPMFEGETVEISGEMLEKYNQRDKK